VVLQQPARGRQVGRREGSRRRTQAIGTSVNPRHSGAHIQQS
jgi:hypothetical protein